MVEHSQDGDEFVLMVNLMVKLYIDINENKNMFNMISTYDMNDLAIEIEQSMTSELGLFFDLQRLTLIIKIFILSK
jgi:hypothetical protein